MYSCGANYFGQSGRRPNLGGQVQAEDGEGTGDLRLMGVLTKTEVDQVKQV